MICCGGALKAKVIWIDSRIPGRFEGQAYNPHLDMKFYFNYSVWKTPNVPKRGDLVDLFVDGTGQVYSAY